MPHDVIILIIFDEAYKTVILYGCETWSPTLREEHRLRVLRILGPKRTEIIVWRKLHN
jgi:hypothetical protein